MYYRKNRRYRNRSEHLQTGFQSAFQWVYSVLQKPRKTISPRSLLLSVLAITLVGALCCQIIWQHVQVARMKYQVASIEKQNHKLKMLSNRGEVEISRLERLERIQRIAVSQLGMEPTDSVPVLELKNVQWVQLPRRKEGGGESVNP